MAELMKFLPAVGTALQVGGAIAGGSADKAAADFQATQLDQAAGQQRAGAQRAASEERRQARLKQSRFQAVARGGGMDPSLVQAAGDIAGEGEYRALTALFEGEDRALGLEGRAGATRSSGKQARVAGYLRGVTSFLSAAPGMFERYGSGGADKYGLGERDKWGRE